MLRKASRRSNRRLSIHTVTPAKIAGLGRLIGFRRRLDQISVLTFLVYLSSNAAIMAHHGVITSINSDSADLARRLYQEAAKTMKYGNLTDEDALRFVTLNPAKQLKIDSRVGSIDVGKDADLAIFNGHPFSIYSRVEMTLIEGEVFFDRKVDLARRDQIAKEKKVLIEAERRTAGQPQPTQTAPTPPPTLTEQEIDGHKHP